VLSKVTQASDELTYGASRIVLQPRNAVRPSARSHNGPLLMSVQPTQPFPSRGHDSFDGSHFPQEEPSQPRAGAAAARR